MGLGPLIVLTMKMGFCPKNPSVCEPSPSYFFFFYFLARLFENKAAAYHLPYPHVSVSCAAWQRVEPVPMIKNQCTL